MLSFWAACPPALAAGTEDDSVGQYYVVKVWAAEDGFAESSVTDVAQTPEGYLWVGTLFGSVLRFDGSRFVSYTSANTPGFVSKWGVPSLMADAAGTLWISMHDGGMTIWDKKGFRPGFSNTNQPGQMLWSAPGKVIFVYGDGRFLSGDLQNEQWHWETIVLPGSQHSADARGRIWYLRNDREIATWNGRETNTVGIESPLEGQRFKVLTADTQGNIWVGTDKNLLEWQTNHFEIMTPTNHEPAINVKKIISSGSGSLWVESNGKMRRCANRQWLAESPGWKREMVNVSLRF